MAQAWPREDGAGFASISTELTDGAGGLRDWSSVYLDYGLTPRLSFSSKIGGRADLSAHEAWASLRVPLPLTLPGVASLRGGLGRWADDGRPTVSTLRLGAAWGKGLSPGDRSGWVELDGLAELARDRGRVKLAATLGLNLDHGGHAILQVRAEPGAGGQGLTLAPSYVHPLHGATKLQLGLLWTPSEGEAGLMLGSWLEF